MRQKGPGVTETLLCAMSEAEGTQTVYILRCK